MAKTLLIILLLSFCTFLKAQETSQHRSNCVDAGPVGFASVDGDGFKGPVTGGGNLFTSGNVVSIAGPGEFEKLVYLLYNRSKAYKNKADYGTAKYAPLILILEEGVYPEAAEVPNSGSVWGNSMLAIEEQGDLTIIGRGDAVLRFGINVKRSWNVIIRNITFQEYNDDGVNIGEPETHHVWVDHCTFGHPTTRPSDKDHPDGGVDIKNGSSYITISRCLFRNSWKTGLVGHSDNNGATDTGRLKTTFYMNYYLNTHSRHPRVRFAEVHVLNNCFEGVTGYGIAAANQARVVAEGNFFKNTVWPMYADRSKADFSAVFGPWSSETGNYPATGLKQLNNLFNDSGLTRVYTPAEINVTMLNPGNKSIRFDELNPDAIFDPHDYYGYTAADAASVPDLVKACSGAGKVDFFTDTSSNSTEVPPHPGCSLRVFPNPANGWFAVETGAPGWLMIIDGQGKVIRQFQVKKGINRFNIKDIKLLPGVYIISVINHKSLSTGKLISAY